MFARLERWSGLPPHPTKRQFSMRQRSVAGLLRHQASLVPLLATIAGLALGLAINTTSGATASGRAEHDRPPLEHRTVGPSPLARRVEPAPEPPKEALDPTVAQAPPAPMKPSDPQPDPGLPAPTGSSRAFAGVRDLTLSLPFGARSIGFHESGSANALSMHPMGIPRVNDNMTKLGSAPVGDGFEYLVLGSRHRRNAPTSAVDVAMPFNWPVQSPVTGTVVDATAYLLYREVPDNAVYIVPDQRQDLVLVLMHLNGLKVNIGDRVEAGSTVLALTARQLPFGSQIDRYAGRMPHVHMELRPR